MTQYEIFTIYCHLFSHLERLIANENTSFI